MTNIIRVDMKNIGVQIVQTVKQCGMTKKIVINILHQEGATT